MYVKGFMVLKSVKIFLALLYNCKNNFNNDVVTQMYSFLLYVDCLA